MSTVTSPLRFRPSHREKQIARWESILIDLAHPAVELDLESVVPLIATFQALRRLGEPMDPALTIIITKLQEQLMDGRREECIDDNEEKGIDCEDSDEDREDSEDYPNFGLIHTTLSIAPIATVKPMDPERAARLAGKAGAA